MRRRCLGLLLLLLLPCVARAQAPAGWDAFARQFPAYADSDRVVGASAAYVRDGRIIARVNFGYADSAAGRRVDDRTIFHWGSITKTLTAIGIMQLRDRGRLSLDDRVVRYIPELRQVHDPYGMLDSITVRMLLSHSAGFMNSTWPYDEGHAWEPFEPTTWNQLVAMMPYQRLHFRPGSRYGYSNPAFIYLARIIEQETGDPWDAYVHKNIFLPLGLQASYFRSTPYHLAAHRSHNYEIEKDSTGVVRRTDNGPDFDPGITTPNGGWNAPLGDLASYMSYLMGVAGAELLQRSSLEEMWRPVVPMSEGYQASANQSMGLSFFIMRRGAQRVIGHTGSQAGFRAFFYFNPETRAGVISAFNTTNYATPAAAAYQRLHTAALDLLF